MRRFAILAALALAGCAGPSQTQESFGEYLDSTVITARVQAELMRDRAVGSQNIRVQTVKGRVELSGFVQTEEEKERAQFLAEGVPGVKSISNLIRVVR